MREVVEGEVIDFVSQEGGFVGDPLFYRETVHVTENVGDVIPGRCMEVLVRSLAAYQGCERWGRGRL